MKSQLDERQDVTKMGTNPTGMVIVSSEFETCILWRVAAMLSVGRLQRSEQRVY